MTNMGKDVTVVEVAAESHGWELVLDGLMGTREHHVVLGLAAGIYNNVLMVAASATELLQAPVPAGLTEAQTRTWWGLLRKAQERQDAGKTFVVLMARQPQRRGGQWVNVWRDHTDGLLAGWCWPSSGPDLYIQGSVDQDAPF